MSAQYTDPIQQQLIDARRNQILDAAIQVFAAKGFHKATIKDIAKEAKIADGTIYNYFENKNALLLAIMDRVNESDQREEHFTSGAAMDLRGFMRSYIQQRFAYLDPNGYTALQVVIPEILTNPELREMYYREIIEPTFQQTEPFFQQWIERGELQPFNIRLMMSAISGMFLGLILLRLIGDTYLKEHWDQLPDLMTQFILNGIAQGKTHGD